MEGLGKKRIVVATRVANKSLLEILFQDFGPGIKEDRHLSAFHRPFTTKNTGGYGLLFIRQMIENMQGDITPLPYQKGNGAAFLIELPIHSSIKEQSD